MKKGFKSLRIPKKFAILMGMKKTLFVFSIAFILNLIWENLHSLLYDNYMGGEITQFILLRATLADAIMITLVALPFLFFSSLKKQSWVMIPALFLISIFIEYYALKTGRWAYNSLMPLVPFLSVGLSPAIQLGLLGYISFKTEERVLQ